MKRTAKLYLIIVSIVGLGIFFILHAGSQLPSPVSRLPNGSVAVATPNSTAVSGSSFFAAVQSGLRQNATNPLSRLFLQLFIIIGASGVVAWLFTRCGQTAVIGEMVAGILLGPSLFGLLAPNAFQFIFAPSSLEALRLLSQIGVCLFLFTVGMELDVSRGAAQGADRSSRQSFQYRHSLLFGSSSGIVLIQSARPTRGLISCLRSIHGHIDEHYRFPCAGSHPAGPWYF